MKKSFLLVAASMAMVLAAPAIAADPGTKPGFNPGISAKGEVAPICRDNWAHGLKGCYGQNP